MDSILPEKVGLSSRRLDRIGTVMRRFIDEGKVPSVQTLVFRRGQLAQAGCYGVMDLDSRRPLLEDALYRIYSMTKPVTCTAVMLLFEEGLLRPIDPIAAYIPAFKDTQVFTTPQENGPDREPLARPILIHDLLTHTAGLAYGLDESTPVDMLYRSANILRGDEILADKIDRLAKLPLLAQPGTRWAYSMAIDVLARLVEVVSGKTLDVFMKERIFDPLGMPDTFFNVPADKLDRLVSLYLANPGEDLVDVLSPPGSLGAAVLAKHPISNAISGALVDKTQQVQFFMGGGGLVSTAADYLRFSRMLLNRGELDGERLLGRKTVEHMSLNQLPAGLEVLPGIGMGYGLGVWLNPAAAMSMVTPGMLEFGGAANTDFFIEPREEMTCVIMSQIFNVANYPIVDTFRSLALQAIID